MSSIDPDVLAEQVLEHLDTVSDADFERRLRTRCPELFEEPSVVPPDALLPERVPERTVAIATSQLERLGSAAVETTRALQQLSASLKTTGRATTGSKRPPTKAPKKGLDRGASGASG